MPKENTTNERKRYEDSTTVFGRSLLTGFIGGVIWSTLGFAMYYFNFSEVSAKTFILRSWLHDGWTDRWLGDVVSITLVGVLSVIAAMIYYGLLKKRESMWVGMLYGIAIWVIVFYVLHPIFKNIPNLMDFNIKTIVSTLSLFSIYGVFIGYSISYDYHDAKNKA